MNQQIINLQNSIPPNYKLTSVPSDGSIYQCPQNQFGTILTIHFTNIRSNGINLPVSRSSLLSISSLRLRSSFFKLSNITALSSCFMKATKSYGRRILNTVSAYKLPTKLEYNFFKSIFLKMYTFQQFYEKTFLAQN